MDAAWHQQQITGQAHRLAETQDVMVGIFTRDDPKGTPKRDAPDLGDFLAAVASTHLDSPPESEQYQWRIARDEAEPRIIVEAK